MNKTRCPWCGKLIDKATDSQKYQKKYFYKYMRISFGCHYGICHHCEKIYNNVPKSALICSFILLGSFGIAMVFPPIFLLAILSIPILVLLSSRGCHFKRIDDYNSGVLKFDEVLKIKAYILKSYYEIWETDILTLFSNFDEQDPFSCVSPISISKIDQKAKLIEGYWLYDHCDNAYFASLDCVHLYDDDGNIVADITFKEPK